MCPIYNYKCSECGLFSDLVNYEDRDAPQDCPKCSSEAPRSWEGHTINNLRTSYLDGSGRFDNLKLLQKLKKEKANARSKGDLETADMLTKESKKVTK